ncbi:uncharacterized protein [Miscanthus floridulus]|uniref:uncharacterized protein n=1 Tax=Miscanthus floridulus TaxID=154761 RepID=UPI00345A55CC
MPEARALGKRAVSPVGSTVEVEQAAARATQPPPPGVEGAPEPGEGRPALTDTGAMPPPPPPPLQRMRDTVRKLLCPHLGRKRQAEAPILAPRKALKVSTSSTAQWVVEVQAAIQRGAVSAGADPKEPVAQGEAIEVAMKQAGEEAPTPREAEAHESDEAEAPLVAEATKGEAEATEAGASRTTEAEVAEAGALGTTEAEVAEAGVGAAEPVAQEAKTEAGQASVPPPVQDPPPSQESAREVERPSPRAAPRALHTGIKRALAVISSHYAGINLEAINDGYVLAEDDEEAEEEVMKLVEAAEAPSTALAKLFEEEVVPPAPTADAGDPEF